MARSLTQPPAADLSCVCLPGAAVTALAAGAAGAALVLAGILAVAEPGPLVVRMGLHFAIMNVAAPLAALGVMRAGSGSGMERLLWPAAGAQMALLWAWHLPAAARAPSAVLQAGFVAALAVAALAFWSGVARATRARRWGAVAALLLTGKLACLLGALMLFAPRDLYGLPALSLGFCSLAPSSLADQQLAGLVMLAVCPLSYVLSGVVLTVAAVGEGGEAPPPAPRSA